MVDEFPKPEPRLLPPMCHPDGVTVARSQQHLINRPAVPHLPRAPTSGGGAQLGISQTRTRPSETSVGPTSLLPPSPVGHTTRGDEHSPARHPQWYTFPDLQALSPVPLRRPVHLPAHPSSHSFIIFPSAPPCRSKSLHPALPLCSLNSLVRPRRNQFSSPSNITPFLNFDGQQRSHGASELEATKHLCILPKRLGARALHGALICSRLYLSLNPGIKTHGVAETNPSSIRSSMSDIRNGR